MKDPVEKSSVPVILSDEMKDLDLKSDLDHRLEACDSLRDLSPSNGATNDGNSYCLTVSSVTESFRSSNSSLAKSENSDSHVSVLKNPNRASSAHVKKVSIAETPPPSLVLRREHAVSPNGGDKLNSHRASLIQVSSCRQARKVRFFINGDKFFKGAVIAVNNEKFRTFDKLLEHLTRIMCTQVTLPNGVRSIYNLEGRLMSIVDEIQVRKKTLRRHFLALAGKLLQYFSLLPLICQS